MIDEEIGRFRFSLGMVVLNVWVAVLPLAFETSYGWNPGSDC